MKRFKTILAAFFVFSLPFGEGWGGASCFAQCIPDIKIDGNSVIADENHPYGVKLPSWLRAGQTLERGNNVFSISVIEFTVNGTALDYSQNLSITTPVQTVPANKVWKIESVHKNAQFTPSVVATYSVAGSYTFTPTCSGYYKIQAWGAGGGGSGTDPCVSCYCNAAGSGGGGGGYTEATFFLSSGTPYTATVGTGGIGGVSNANGTAGGTSVFNGPSSISATGGGGGSKTVCLGGGGAGGTGSGGQANVSGAAGGPASGAGGSSGAGGAGANGGGGGGGSVSSSNGIVGTAPGGGGSGGGSSSGWSGGTGAVGRVIISLGGGTISSSRVPCTTIYLYGSSCAATPACPTGWNDAGCGIISAGAYCRSCYRCD